jgi:hypothetical protein
MSAPNIASTSKDKTPAVAADSNFTFLSST